MSIPSLPWYDHVITDPCSQAVPFLRGIRADVCLKLCLQMKDFGVMLAMGDKITFMCPCVFHQ
jgi:hypothetical protein